MVHSAPLADEEEGGTSNKENSYPCKKYVVTQKNNFAAPSVKAKDSAD